MNILNAQVNPALAKNIMYLCMTAPAVAFGLRMAKSATEYVDGASGDRALGVSSRARLLDPSPFLALCLDPDAPPRRPLFHRRPLPERPAPPADK